MHIENVHFLIHTVANVWVSKCQTGITVQKWCIWHRSESVRTIAKKTPYTALLLCAYKAFCTISLCTGIFSGGSRMMFI